ncbi:alcohol dehydrogenase catalytic domain-containing protein [Pyrobaculum sp. 3827-6]|uniref:alcohol dehydrogenase catalytic domain-containing protein n=1 Tax=Pyrobaculum sp. 3827-6 TaxID=2983604 RepID=UPI0021D9DC76|nr:alcohol dehydrogenase catalytic domain-containing protein [Pyrobaculum sp. 3827-6]MCU7787467.1 alcohol dehydrogenase catalytic domain-containing protein [Pyrobaculum sp. 3827-6]
MKIPLRIRAALYKGPGHPLEISEISSPTPGEGEVLVKVAATGICHSDLHILDGEIIPPPEGFILGHEVSGWLVEFGPRCENPHGLSPGDPVVVSWIIPCGKCYWCVRGQENYCPYAAARMPGLVGLNGGHAEYMAVPETAVYPIPKGLDIHSAAVISCAYGTAYRALKEAGVGPGTGLVIVGVGGVGLAAVELANALGARPIVAVDMRKTALEKAKELGATHVIGTTDGDPISAIRDVLPQGADVVYETKPNPDLKIALESVRRGGTIIVTGLGTSTVEIPASHLVMNGIKIVGSLGYRPRVDIPELLSLAAAGKINPQRLISHIYKPEEINTAYEGLRQGRHTRALVIWNTTP